jgi:hypothetical protein
MGKMWLLHCFLKLIESPMRAFVSLFAPLFHACYWASPPEEPSEAKPSFHLHVVDSAAHGDGHLHEPVPSSAHPVWKQKT